MGLLGVREKRVKMKEKKDSFIMLNNVLKIKKEEVAELRRRVAGRVRHPPEPCHREGSTCQQPAGEGSYPVSVGSTEGERWNWRKDIFEEFNRNARMNPPKGERDQICVEMRRGAVSINEASSAEEVDQGSRDWMRRRLLKRENTWDLKRASTIGCRSFPFKRTLSAPSVEKLDPELVVMDNSAVTTGSSNPLRLGTQTPCASRPVASGRCYSCHEWGHYARDCAGRKQAKKPDTTRSISSRRSFQEKGCIGREDLGSRTVKDEDRAKDHQTSKE